MRGDPLKNLKKTSKKFKKGIDKGETPWYNWKVGANEPARKWSLKIEQREIVQSTASAKKYLDNSEKRNTL